MQDILQWNPSMKNTNWEPTFCRVPNSGQG